MADRQFTSAVGAKFHEDGQLRHFPGNTIVAHLPDDGSIYREALWAQAEVMGLPFAHKYTFLPPHSFHMTVFELLCDQVRDSEHWSSHLDSSIDLKQTDVYLEERATGIEPPDRIPMRFDRIQVSRHPSISLQPADTNAATTLREYREKLSAATGLRFANHDTYRYHISLAYLLEHLTEKEGVAVSEAEERIGIRLAETLSRFELPAPRVAFFDHMHAFHPDKNRTVRWE